MHCSLLYSVVFLYRKQVFRSKKTYNDVVMYTDDEPKNPTTQDSLVYITSVQACYFLFFSQLNIEKYYGNIFHCLNII